MIGGCIQRWLKNENIVKCMTNWKFMKIDDKEWGFIDKRWIVAIILHRLERN